jgi:hypothetical protein
MRPDRSSKRWLRETAEILGKGKPMTSAECPGETGLPCVDTCNSHNIAYQKKIFKRKDGVGIAACCLIKHRQTRRDGRMTNGVDISD